METLNIQELKYPIGEFVAPLHFEFDKVPHIISKIETFPNLIKNQVQHLTVEQLKLKYREGGWSVAQVVNHCADSHINAFIRLKLALTEDYPTIKPYNQNLFAELPDSNESNVDDSLQILEAVHKKWCVILKQMQEQDFLKGYIHPEYNKKYTLFEFISLYAWHGKHHLAQIKSVFKNLNN